MKKKKNIAVKVLAILALVGIVISIIGTALLVLTSNNSSNYTTTETVTAEQLQELIGENNITVTTASGEILEATDDTLEEIEAPESEVIEIVEESNQ